MMPVVAMTASAARDAENSDSLRVYTFEAPGQESVQIVANKSNIYQIGDVAAVALVGTVLADGIEIKKAKLRGLLSFGMALGPSSDLPGTLLTEKMGARDIAPVDNSAEGVVEESIWARYTSIPSFLKVKTEILAVPEVIVTEKAHGSSFRVGQQRGVYVVGTHTSRIVPSRMDPQTWPEGHLIRKMLDWSVQVGMENRVSSWNLAHPEANSMGIYGELYGFKCSYLHYGLTTSQVRFFGEATIDGRWLDYEDALLILKELFPDYPLSEIMLPILYRGKPFLQILKDLRDRPSVLAKMYGVDQISEGIVVRPTTELFSESTKDRLIAKYKSPLYEERKQLRSADPESLPVYLTAYDLIADFVTPERVRHVLAKAEASGMEISPKKIRDLAALLFADIKKESVGEWPSVSDTLSEGVMVKWTLNMAGDMISEQVSGRQADLNQHG